MADIKLDGLTVASSSGSPTVVNIDSDVASRITAKGIAKAWVVFNGSIDPSGTAIASGDGTALIKASYNVTSITWEANGRYKLMLPSTNPLSDLNPCIAGNASFCDTTDDANSGVVAIRRLGSNSSPTVTSTSIPFQTTYYGSAGNFSNFSYVNVMVFGS